MANRIASALLAATMVMSSGALAGTPAGSADILVHGAVLADGSQIERVISYNDAAMRSEAGRKALMTRLSFAIASLCDESVSAVTDPVASLKCNNAAWASANAQLAGMRLASR